MTAKFGVFVDKDHSKLLTLYNTDYLNFKNGPISYVLLLILIHVHLPSCLFFTSCLTVIKPMSLNIAQQFVKGMVNIYFGLLKCR